MQSNNVLKRQISDTIRIDYRDTFIINSSPPNLDVKSLCSRVVNPTIGVVLSLHMVCKGLVCRGPASNPITVVTLA